MLGKRMMGETELGDSAREPRGKVIEIAKPSGIGRELCDKRHRAMIYL
jgi:hypothetical protein